jgi:hypothetical protein
MSSVSAADAQLDALIDEYEFKPYRNYRIMSRRRQAAVLRAEIARARTVEAGGFAFAAGTGSDVAVAICRPLAWDTAWFGVPMARVDHILRGAGVDRRAISTTVDGALQRLKAGGIKHVAARVDVADTEAISALEDAGFRLMDALMTYIYHPKREPPTRVKEVGLVRPFIAADTEQVLEITREAYRGFRGRFHLDPHLPEDRSDELYIEWARKCCEGQMADRIFVADAGDGRLHGWCAVRLVEPASSIGGIRLVVGSLGACRRDRPGAYAGLIRAAAAENHALGGITETQTQNFNFSTVRVMEAVGAEYVRADYTFHAWIE